MSAEEKAVEAEQVSQTWPEVADKALTSLQEGIGEVGKVIHNIGVELSETAPHIWKGLVEYHRWMAIGDLLKTIIMIVLSILSIYYGKKLYSIAKKDGENNKVKTFIGYEWPEEVKLRFAIACAMMWLGVIIIMISISFIHYDIAAVVVPERAAAIEIINVIKSGGEVPQR